MNNNTNIYDIDGELVRSANDPHKWTVKEAQDKVEYYRKKLVEVGENSPKATIYATYMRNLNNYIMAMYASMSKEELQAEISKAQAEISTQEAIEKAMNELKNEFDNESNTPESTTPETGGDEQLDNEVELPLAITPSVNTDSEQPLEQPTPALTQDDMLVDREGEVTNMDEYIEV